MIIIIFASCAKRCLMTLATISSWIAVQYARKGTQCGTRFVRQLNNTGCLLPYNNLDDYNLFDTMIGGNHAVIKKNEHILDIFSLLYIVANEISTIFNTVKVLFDKL